MPPPDELITMAVLTRMQTRWTFGVHLDAGGGLVHLFTVHERWSQGRACVFEYPAPASTTVVLPPGKPRRGGADKCV